MLRALYRNLFNDIHGLFHPSSIFSRISSVPSQRPLSDTPQKVSPGLSEHDRKPVLENIDASDPKTADMLRTSMEIFEDFLSEEEEKSILNEIEPYLKRLRYEFDHWDDAIHGYRETERLRWNESNQKILQRVREIAFSRADSPMVYTHILDISKEGFIKPHVDSVRFCGSTIAGMSLLSSSVMKLVHEKQPSMSALCLLKRRSLYIMRNQSRYEFTHEVLAEKDSYFKGNKIERDRRVSVMCRNEPRENQ